MALAVTATSTTTKTSPTDPWTWNINSTGSNKVLVVTIASYQRHPSSVTHDSVSMTLKQSSNNGNFYTSVWTLINPTNGNKTISVDFSEGTLGSGGAVFFTGADQTTQ